MSKKDKDNKPRIPKVNHIDTIEKLIVKLYQDEIEALQIAASNAYTSSFKDEMRGKAAGIAQSRRYIEALYVNDYKLGF